jgi:hypothetical protein
MESAGAAAQRLVPQLRALTQAPSQSYIPLRPKGTKRPSGARDTFGPSVACAGYAAARGSSSRSSRVTTSLRMTV